MKRIILFIILTTSAICYGLNEIRVYYPSNYSVFSTVRNQSGQIWNGSAFEDFNDIYDCNIPMTDKLGGLYLGNFPSCDANSYTIMSYFDSDSTPDNNDVLIQFEEGYWTGTLWRSSRDRLEDIKAETGLIADVNNNLNTAISNITVDNGAIADEVVLHMDANSTQLAAIVEDTGTTLPSLINDVNTAIVTDISGINTLITDVNTAIIGDINDVSGSLDSVQSSLTDLIRRIVYKFIRIEGDTRQEP
jgi:hypothetical protein